MANSSIDIQSLRAFGILLRVEFTDCLQNVASHMAWI